MQFDMKTFALLLFPAIISCLTSFAEESRPGVRAALQALPPHLAKQVVRISADNGRPDPMRGYVLARNRSEAGLFLRNPLYSITITDGQLSEAKRFVDARQIFNQRNFINIPSVRIDSSVAFSIARNALGPAASACAVPAINSLSEGAPPIRFGRFGLTESPIDTLGW